MKRSIAAVASVSLALAACSGGGSSAVDTLAPTSAPPSSLPPVTTAAATTSLPTTSTIPEPTLTTVVPDGVARLSDDGPWRLVDSAPGVTTPGLVYELMPKLWAFLPTEESPDDGNLYVPHPDDIPIIEAYLRARLVYYRAITSRPMDLDSPDWQRYYADGGRAIRNALQARASEGQFGDIEAGVVLRPFVVGDDRTPTSATLGDCTLDGLVVRRADGTLAPGSTPGVVAEGLIATVLRVDQSWRLERITDNVDGVCQ